MEFFYSLKNKFLNHKSILYIKQQIEQIHKILEKNQNWQIFLIYYKKFDAKGNAVMDELEAHVEQKKKEFFAQNEEEYQQFYRDVKVTMSWAWLFFLHLEMWEIIFPYIPFTFLGYVPYNELKFPPHMIVHAAFRSYDRIHKVMFFDKPFRDYTPLSFTIDSGLPIPPDLIDNLIYFVFVFFFSMLNAFCALILGIIEFISTFF